MALKIIIEIFGIILVLLGSYLLAGEYLLGERIKKLDEWLKKLSNSPSYFFGIKKLLVNPPNGIYPTLSWQQYRRRLIRGVIIILIPMLLWIFFIGKALTKLVPMYLNIPITLFSSFIIWFLILWISLSVEVVIYMIRYSPNTYGMRISWWILIPASILGVIVQLFQGLTFKVAVIIFLRYAIDISIFPLKKINLFGQRNNLGSLPALLGAILLAVGVILTFISQHL